MMEEIKTDKVTALFDKSLKFSIENLSKAKRKSLRLSQGLDYCFKSMDKNLLQPNSYIYPYLQSRAQCVGGGGEQKNIMSEIVATNVMSSRLLEGRLTGTSTARAKMINVGKVLTNMKNCILATDLALFFPNKARLANIVKDNVFDWDQPDHRFFLVPTHKYYQDQPKNAGHGSMHDWK